MLKTVSSVANALGALNYKGTWNATTNTPTLASGVGTQGDYYVVSVAGTTDLDGITNWGVGDWAAFNGSVWQRVEGGADGNFVNLTVTGEMTVDTDTLVVNDTSNNVGIGTASPNASGSLHILRAGSSIISNLIANSGAILESGSGSVGFNVITPNTAGGYINFGDPEDSNAGRILYSHATNAMSFGTNDSTIRLEIDASGNTNVKTGNLVIGTSGKGIDFSATAGTGTSELLDDYEEGAFLPVIGDNAANLATMAIQNGRYTKIGNLVNWYAYLSWTSLGSISGLIRMNGLPFTSSSASNNYASVNCNFASGLTVTAGNNIGGYVELNQAYAQLTVWSATTGTPDMPAASLGAVGSMMLTGSYEV